VPLQAEAEVGAYKPVVVLLLVLVLVFLLGVTAAAAFWTTSRVLSAMVGLVSVWQCEETLAKAPHMEGNG